MSAKVVEKLKIFVYALAFILYGDGDIGKICGGISEKEI
jgi:hypothetical protein